MQFIRQGKLSGIIASTPEIVSTIEERIGQLHVDDLERRKSNAKCFLAEETGFVILAAGESSLLSNTIINFDEGIMDFCSVEFFLFLLKTPWV